MKKGILWSVCVVLLVTAAWFVGRSCGQKKDRDRGGEASQPSSDTVEIGVKEKSKQAENEIQRKPSIQEQVFQIVEREVLPMDDPETMERYLEELENRAKKNGKVTALEVEPGLKAIERFENTLGFEKTDAIRENFTRRMSELSRQFRLEEKETKPDLDTLAEQIEGSEGELKRSLLKKFMEATMSMDPPERDEAMKKIGH